MVTKSVENMVGVIIAGVIVFSILAGTASTFFINWTDALPNAPSAIQIVMPFLVLLFVLGVVFGTVAMARNRR